jgi:predicted SAM-dependent methyltransferase
MQPSTSSRKLDLGGGLHPRQGYLNIDIRPLPTVDLVHDLRTGIPFPDNSVDEIFMNHTLEHFNFKEAKNLLQECFRVLKPKGKIEVIVPDVKSACECLLQKGWKPIVLYMLYGAQEYPEDHHKNGFDYQRLKQHLEEAGFVNIQQIPSNPFDEVNHYEAHAIAYKP